MANRQYTDQYAIERDATDLGDGGYADVVALAAGTAIVGKVAIDQTTPGTTNGVQVNAALPAGTNIIGSNLSRSASVAVTPAITASSAYTAGNEVGGLMTFASMFGTANSGIVQDIKIKCKSVQTVQFTLYIFKTNPTNSTWTDKSAPAINAADIPFLEVAIPFTAPYSGLGTHTLYSVDAAGIEIVASSTSLYAVLVTSGTPTFASTSDITVEIVVLQD